MRNFIYLLMLVCIPAWMEASAQNRLKEDLTEEKEVYFSCDFQQGLPADFKLYTRDNLNYHWYMLQQGFNDSKPWLCAQEKAGSDNYCAASTSFYYEETEPASDWLITPSVFVPNNQVQLTWKSRSDAIVEGSQYNIPGGYSVFISTTGQTPEDFTEEAVFSIPEESDTEWFSHSVDLEKYKGKTIYVAFVNNTTHKGIILVDDIQVCGEPRNARLEVANPSHVFGAQEVSIQCTVTGRTETPVSNVTAHYSYKGETYTKEATGLNLTQNQSHTITFDEKIAMNVSDTIHFKAWAEIDGEDYPLAASQIACLAFKPARKVVIEEGTGMWCGYCPLGILAFRELTQKYPDNFIGIAVHNGDRLALDNYDRALNFSSYPAGKINRKITTTSPMTQQIDEQGKSYYSGLGGGFETHFLKELENITSASVKLEANYTTQEKKEIEATVKYRFVKNYENASFKIAFVLIENHVAGDGFYQNNSLSGKNVEAGGFEKEPAKITDIVFEEVARGIFDSFNGIAGSIPATLTADQEMSYDYTIQVPEAIYDIPLKPDNLELVAMIIDNTTGEIVNADKVALGNGLSIDTENKIHDFSYTITNNYCTVYPSSISFNGTANIVLISLDGQIIVNHSVACTEEAPLNFPVQGLKGTYLLKLTANNKTEIHKIFIR